MRATTIRFPDDLWQELEREARRQGTSVAQYVRDATLYRLAYTAGAAAEEAGEGSRFRRPPARRPSR